MARRAAAEGERVLAIDAAAGHGLGLALGATGALAPGEMVELGPAAELITVLVLDTQAALDQYLRLNLRVPIPARSLEPVAKIFDFVATAAPAVREILAIGKIGHEVRRGYWDLVVVDGPATGHAVEFLSAPDALSEIVGIGPLAGETAWLSELLNEAKTTRLIAVTVAEELPVSETLELVARFRTETGMTVAGLVINRWPPVVTAAGHSEAIALLDRGDQLAELALSAVQRAKQAEEERRRLDRLDLPVVLIDEDDHPVDAAVRRLTRADW